jgi:hypothetical protein
MRTNIHIPDELHAKFLAACKARGYTMAEVICAYIRIELDTPTMTATDNPGRAETPEEAIARRSEATRRTLARDADIMRRHAARETLGDIGSHWGLTASGVSRILSRHGKS